MAIQYQVGEVVSPAQDYAYNGYTYPIATASGTVINKSILAEAPTEENSTYTYLIEFPTTVLGVNEAGDTIAQSQFWLSEYDLGLTEVAALDAVIDPNASRVAVAQAQSNIFNALQVTDNAISSVGASPFKDKLKQNRTSLSNMNTTIQNTSVAGSTISVEQQAAFLANTASETLGNDSVLVQEMSENISQIQSVIDEMNSELHTAARNGEQQVNASNASNEEDYTAFMNTFISTGPTTSIVNIQNEIDLWKSENLTPEIDEETTWELG